MMTQEKREQAQAVDFTQAAPRLIRLAAAAGKKAPTVRELAEPFIAELRLYHHHESARLMEDLVALLELQMRLIESFAPSTKKEMTR